MQESFYNYVSGYGNILILGCLESYGARLCNIFSDCGVAKWPGVYNIQEVILEAAKKAIYPKAMLSIKMEQNGVWTILEACSIISRWLLL